MARKSSVRTVHYFSGQIKSHICYTSSLNLHVPKEELLVLSCVMENEVSLQQNQLERAEDNKRAFIMQSVGGNQESVDIQGQGEKQREGQSGRPPGGSDFSAELW